VSCRATELVEERCLGLLHSLCCVGVAEDSGDSFQGVDAESGAQELVWIFHRQQGFQWSLVALVADAFSPLEIDFDLRLGAGPVVVQVGVEVVSLEAVDGLCVRRADVSVADVFADHRAVFGLDQAVVSRVAGAALGLFDAQFFE